MSIFLKILLVALGKTLGMHPLSFIPSSYHWYIQVSCFPISLYFHADEACSLNLLNSNLYPSLGTGPVHIPARFGQKAISSQSNNWQPESGWQTG